jgi:ATP-dependent 26S proteasome regulatory subunit
MVGPFLRPIAPLSDDIVTFPDGLITKILSGIKKFWASKKAYESYGMLHKRGILLYGPPGTGKSVIIRKVSQEAAANGAVTIFGNDPGITISNLGAVRTVQPDLPILVILEDLDVIVENEGERSITSLLDGERQIDNVVYIATTNNKHELSTRLTNRPSRFDELIDIGYPPQAERKSYLTTVLQRAGDTVNKATIELWSQITEGLAFAHLREFVVAVRCLGQDPQVVLARLKEMAKEKDEE